MRVDKETVAKMKKLADMHNMKLDAESFVYLSCECLMEEIIDLFIERKCDVEDINVLTNLLNIKMKNLLIKKEDTKSPSACK